MRDLPGQVSAKLILASLAFATVVAVVRLIGDGPLVMIVLVVVVGAVAMGRTFFILGIDEGDRVPELLDRRIHRLRDLSPDERRELHPAEASIDRVIYDVRGSLTMLDEIAEWLDRGNRLPTGDGGSNRDRPITPSEEVIQRARLGLLDTIDSLGSESAPARSPGAGAGSSGRIS